MFEITQRLNASIHALASYLISGAFLSVVLVCALLHEAYDRLTRKPRIYTEHTAKRDHQKQRHKPQHKYNSHISFAPTTATGDTEPRISISSNIHSHDNHHKSQHHHRQHHHHHHHSNQQLQHQHHVPEIIRFHGYDLDIHRVHTPDGHILAFQHIHPKQTLSKKVVVVLQHGLLQSSAVYVMNEEKSLGFVLADYGFDVWLSNTRTNLHCSHAKIKKNHQKYWDYTIDDLGEFDFPTIVRFVLKKTGAKKIVYIGHSQGVTKAIAGLNYHPKLNNKIQLLVALNPGVYVQPMSNLVVDRLAKTSTNTFFEVMGRGEFLPMMETIRKWIPASIFSIFAYSMSSFMFGWKDINWNRKQKPLFFSQTPAGASVANVAHWFQMYQANKFQRFDYGPEQNMKKYGQPTPPQYDLGKVTVRLTHNIS
eukprot:TRINITY_DN2854_c0_g1_i3.p1 TRINITY_DN2854_c0_g1~~TRINITY_DN2854_c0_g1_i3.p1  ORF type:complete len:422 (-),score=89.94 TRINITY_DN2854_c0_g1_i3:634-1899(-)